MSRRGGHRLRERLRSLYLWHRWIGILAAPLIVGLVVTGIALNHAEGLRLSQRHVSSPALLSPYGLRAEGGDDPVGFRTPAGWLSVFRGRLYLDARRIGEFEDRLLAAAGNSSLVAAFGQTRWLLATADGQLLERGAATDLPLRPDRAAFADQRLCIASATDAWCSEDLGLAWQRVPEGLVPATTPSPLPNALVEALRSDSIRDRISWARLLADLHTGRLFGRAGVLLVDAAAVLLLALALSGPLLWWRQRRRRRRRPGRGV